MCHRLPSGNTGSLTIIAKFVRPETKFRVMTSKRNWKKSSEKTYIHEVVTLLQAKSARALRQRPEVNYVKMFNEKVVPAMSDDERHKLNKSFDLRERDLKFLDSVCNEFGSFRRWTFQKNDPTHICK